MYVRQHLSANLYCILHCVIYLYLHVLAKRLNDAFQHLHIMLIKIQKPIVINVRTPLFITLHGLTFMGINNLTQSISVTPCFPESMALCLSTSITFEVLLIQVLHRKSALSELQWIPRLPQMYSLAVTICSWAAANLFLALELIPRLLHIKYLFLGCYNLFVDCCKFIPTLPTS